MGRIRTLKAWILGAVALCVVCAAGLLTRTEFPGGGEAHAASPSLADPSLEPLYIDTATGRHEFRVELAATEAQRERGLMFRRSMPADRGMLFDFKTSQPVMMWMKNTYIPLDMVFISRSGRVTHVAADAEPLSEAIIPSDGPVFAVLELNGGEARKIDLKPGDKIENRLFAR